MTRIFESSSRAPATRRVKRHAHLKKESPLRALRSWLWLTALFIPSIFISIAAPLPQAPTDRRSAQDWPFGPYQVVANWPKPLPDTRHSHNGWTWGSMGSVYAETPDRIWVAQRGELPLPAGIAPWTPYAALNPSRGNSNSKYRRTKRDLSGCAVAGLGTSLGACDFCRRPQWQSHRRVAATRQTLRPAAVWSRSSHDQDEPV